MERVCWGEQFHRPIYMRIMSGIAAEHAADVRQSRYIEQARKRCRPMRQPHHSHHPQCDKRMTAVLVVSPSGGK